MNVRFIEQKNKDIHVKIGYEKVGTISEGRFYTSESLCFVRPLSINDMRGIIKKMKGGE